jgi:hypothetical protein
MPIPNQTHPQPTGFTVYEKATPVDHGQLPTMTLEEAYKIAPLPAMMTPDHLIHRHERYTPEQIYVAEQMVRNDIQKKLLKPQDAGWSASFESGPGVVAKPGDTIKHVNLFNPPKRDDMLAEAQASGTHCIMYTYNPDTTAFLTLISYILISLIIAVVVGRYLFKNGQVFLARIFNDDTLSLATNRLLLTGFYLINIGYILLTVNAPDDQFRAIHSSAMWLQFLCTKIGLVVVVLGAMHFFNMGVLWFLSTRKKDCADTTAIAP